MKVHNFVIPAKAGIQFLTDGSPLDPRLRGDDERGGMVMKTVSKAGFPLVGVLFGGLAAFRVKKRGAD